MPLIGTRRDPKGPNLTQLKKHQFVLSGIKINISSPLSNHPRHRGGEEASPINIYDRTSFGETEEPEDPIELGLLGRKWVYKGLPIFDWNKLGDMSMNISVSRIPEFRSLFRPRRLECAIERYILLSRLFATSGYSRFNYNHQTINGIDWANYLCYPDEDEDKHEYNSFQTVWQTSITDEHLLTVRFTQSPCAKDSGLMRAYAKLMEVIMSSITIKLPQDIQALKTEVQEAYPYESFPTFMPPYIFERFEPRDKFEVIDEVAASYNFETSDIPRAVFTKQVEEIMTTESKKKEDIRQQVLKEHLRFEELEGEDYQRYLSQQNESATEA